MTQFFALVISGAVSGAAYSLIAAGTVLTYSLSGVFNFAYGAIAFTVAFSFFELNTGLGWPVWAAAVVSLAVVAPLVGWLLDVLIFRRLSAADDVAKIVATLGLAVALPALVQWIAQRAGSVFHLNLPSAANVVLPVGLGPSPEHVYHPGLGVVVTSTQLVLLGSATGIAALLWFVQMRLPIGLRMRAMVDRRSLAAIRGVDLGRTSAAGWVLGVTVAGVTGVLAAPILALAPGQFTAIFFVAATAAVVGGLRSLPIALLAGLGLGIAQNLVTGYLTFTQSIVGFGSSVPFVILLAGLLIMSRDRSRVAGVVAASPPAASHVDDLPVWRQRAPWAVAAVVLAIYILFVADQLWLGLIVTGLALAVVLLSFVVVVGIGGMVSLAQAALVTTAALLTGELLSHHVPLILAAFCGIAAATVMGLILSLPAMRLGGLALALCTLAIGLVADAVLFQWHWLANGAFGWIYPAQKLGPVDLANQKTMAVFLGVVICIVIWLIRNLQHSATGRAMLAVRSTSVAAATVGISPARTKLIVFGVSAAIAGLGGVLLSMVNLGITSTLYPSPVGLTWLVAVVLFGVRRPGGAVLAGLAISVGPELLGRVTQSTYIPEILFGLGAVALAQNPDGAIADVSAKLRKRRLRRAAPAAPMAQPVAASAPAASRAGEPARSSESQPHGLTLRVTGLSAQYGPVPVLADISLDVAPGSITALLGANGAGKSTLCSVLCGLHRQTTGQILFNGQDISTWSANQRATHGLVLAPESRGVFPGLTVHENLRVWLHTQDERLLAYERFPSLTARRNVLAGSLSGGEQQMLAMAPVVVRKPSLLVADEPSLGLAPRIADEVTQTLRTLRDDGVAVLVVEERPRRVFDIADHVVFLELGHVTWQGRPSERTADSLAMGMLGSPLSDQSTSPGHDPLPTKRPR